MTPLTILKHYFGYTEFRSGQLEIITSLINRQDSLILMPTGGGKSLCFQVPGVMLKGTTIVVSPLISLMKDQVDTLNSKGIPATYINSSLSRSEMNQRLLLLKFGKYKFIYVAPERLQQKKFIQCCQNLAIPLLIVDEAHCISQWGNQFRPEFRQISQFVGKLPERPTVAAFTATATKVVQDDITTSLQLQNHVVHAQSFKRSNLYLDIIHCSTRNFQELMLFTILARHRNESGIIYCVTREAAEYLAKLSELYSFSPLFSQPILAYHGGMSAHERNLVQIAFLNGASQVIAATNAFGMGIDKPNIRFIIHFQIPENIENYYQEAGRAGRDGQLAHCYFLYLPNNFKIHSRLLDENSPQIENNIAKLKAVETYANSLYCRTRVLLHYFDQTGENCHNCDNCSKSQKIYAHTLTKNKQLLSLLKVRETLAKKYRCHPNSILTDTALYLSSIHSPKTSQQLATIPGIGQGWLDTWWQEFKPILQI